MVVEVVFGCGGCGVSSVSGLQAGWRDCDLNHDVSRPVEVEDFDLIALADCAKRALSNSPHPLAAAACTRLEVVGDWECRPQCGGRSI